MTGGDDMGAAVDRNRARRRGAGRRFGLAAALSAFALLWLGGFAAAQDTAAPGSALGRVTNAEHARAAIFVLENYLSEDNDLSAVAAQYADTVYYYDLGPQSIESVLADKSAYLQRWPVRRFGPDLETLTVLEVAEGELRVSVEVAFDVANSTRQISGRSLIEITVARFAAGFKIVAENGRVLSRR